MTATLSIGTKQFVEDYLKALSGKPKTSATIDLYVNDPRLRQHILDTEAAFPEYEIIPHQFFGDGDIVAVEATFRGVHKGPIAGIAPTGKLVSGEALLFYQVADSRIIQFWMQFDMHSILSQLATKQQ